MMSTKYNYIVKLCYYYYHFFIIYTLTDKTLGKIQEQFLSTDRDSRLCLRRLTCRLLLFTVYCFVEHSHDNSKISDDQGCCLHEHKHVKNFTAQIID